MGFDKAVILYKNTVLVEAYNAGNPEMNHAKESVD